MSDAFDPESLGAAAAAEAQGTLVGALAAGEPPAAAAGLAAAVAAGAEAAGLEAWARALRGTLAEGQLGLRLQLPADREPLALRIEALAAWVRGFLSGLGQAGTRLQALGAASDESLSDLDAIARGAAVTEGASEAEERAYTELVEYVRLAVQTLFESLRASPERSVRGKMQS